MQFLGVQLWRPAAPVLVAILSMLLALSASDAFGETALVVDVQILVSSDDAYDAPAGWPGYDDDSGRVFAGTPSSSPITAGWRWTGVGLPSNAVISSAYVTLVQKDWGNEITTTLALEDAASPSTFRPGSSPADRWSSRTAFEIQWSWEPQTPGASIQTPSLVSGIQELVNTHGAVDEIVLLEDGGGVPLGRYHEWESFERAGPSAAELHIEYLVLTLIEPSPGQAGVTNTFDVSGATPGATVLLVAGVSPGSTPLPWCASSTVDIGSPRLLGSAKADAGGNAGIIVDLPSMAAGRTLLFQTTYRSSCAVSNLVTFDFP